MNILMVFGLMFFFILLETPLFLAVGLAGMIYTLVFCEVSTLVQVTYQMTTGLDSFALLAIPFYMFAGEIMNAGGLTQRIVDFAGSVLRYLRGGLVYVNITANIIMAGISGSAIADAAATGAVLIPAMDKEGYDKPFAGAITCAAATMGPIIPPSVPIILFGILSGAPIDKLFLAGVVPGLLMGLMLFVSSYFIAVRRSYPKAKGRINALEVWANFKKAFLALLLPVIVLGGIFTGITTVTEAGAIAVVYAMLAGILVYREIRWSSLPKMVFKIAYQAAILLVALATVQILSYIIADMQLADLINQKLADFTANKYFILILINVFLLLVGCVMDPLTAIILLTPVLLPVTRVVGIDPVHFGVIMVLNLMIGLSTPPIGGLLFVTTIIADVPMSSLVKEILPLVLLFILLLLIITFIPQIVLFLPYLIG